MMVGGGIRPAPPPSAVEGGATRDGRCSGGRTSLVRSSLASAFPEGQGQHIGMPLMVGGGGDQVRWRRAAAVAMPAAKSLTFWDVPEAQAAVGREVARTLN